MAYDCESGKEFAPNRESNQLTIERFDVQLIRTRCYVLSRFTAHLPNFVLTSDWRCCVISQTLFRI